MPGKKGKEDKKSILPVRDFYAVKDLMNDLKKIDPTPSVLDIIGSQLIYFEWSQAEQLLGDDNPITVQFAAILEFMQGGYEKLLVEGEFWRAKDTPRAALNQLTKGVPSEFLSYKLERDAEYIRNLLKSILKLRQEEIEEYKGIEKGVRKEIKENPEDPDLWNKLRLLLWILGKYPESSEAFRKAKKFGWDKSSSHLVAL